MDDKFPPRLADLTDADFLARAAVRIEMEWMRPIDEQFRGPAWAVLADEFLRRWPQAWKALLAEAAGMARAARRQTQQGNAEALKRLGGQ